MKAFLTFGSLFCLRVSADEQCAATLEVSSLTGPTQCTPEGMKQITDAQAKAVTECFLECAGSYDIKADSEKGSTAALAVPKAKTCVKQDLGLTIVCSPVVLACSKPFNDFPNACSGFVPLVQGMKVFVAFYSYCAPGESGLTSILDTQAIFDAETVCRGKYTYDTQNGSCLGLPKGAQTCEKADTPPEPPKVDGAPLLFPLVGAGSGKCDASLMTQTVAGPVGCTQDSLPQIPDEQARAVIECFHECAASYTLGWKVGQSWQVAVATPKLQKCTKVNVVCAPVALMCTKPFGEFPNACAGVVTMQLPFYVAFYSYGREVNGKVTTVLDTRVVVDKDTVCSGMYSVNSGECMGLGGGAQSDGVVQPPQPPAVQGLPLDSWPVPDAEKPQTPTDKPTDEPTDEPTDKPTDKPTESPTDPTDAPTKQPEETTKKPEPEPEKKSSSGNVFLWICLCLVLLLIVGFAFFYRRNRLVEEERSFRDAQVVELPSSTNPF